MEHFSRFIVFTIVIQFQMSAQSFLAEVQDSRAKYLAATLDMKIIRETGNVHLVHGALHGDTLPHERLLVLWLMLVCHGYDDLGGGGGGGGGVCVCFVFVCVCVCMCVGELESE